MCLSWFRFVVVLKILKRFVNRFENCWFCTYLYLTSTNVSPMCELEVITIKAVCFPDEARQWFRTGCCHPDQWRSKWSSEVWWSMCEICAVRDSRMSCGFGSYSSSKIMDSKFYRPSVFRRNFMKAESKWWSIFLWIRNRNRQLKFERWKFETE